MASSSSPSFFLLAAVMLSVCLSCHGQGQPDLIGFICNKTVNDRLCNRILRSDPRSAGANLAALGKIAVEKSLVAAHDTLRVAQHHANGTTNSTDKAATATAEVCVTSAGDSADLLNQCLSILGSFGKAPITTTSVKDLQTYGSGVIADMSTCDQAYGPGAQPVDLQRATGRTKVLLNVALVVFNNLKAVEPPAGTMKST